MHTCLPAVVGIRRVFYMPNQPREAAIEKAFLIKGQTGAKYDLSAWTVAVVLTETKARVIVDMCNSAARALIADVVAERGSCDLYITSTKFDPFFHCFGGVTTYSYEAVPFLEAEGELDMWAWHAPKSA